MPKYINANSFLEYEENRCKNFPPLIGTCSFDNVTLREELENFLAADVEPVIHGHWIYECSLPSASEMGETLLWKCSVCGYTSFNISTKYCPNCGAKMDKKKENEV